MKYNPKYYLSREEKRELTAFCAQYDHKKSMAKSGCAHAKRDVELIENAVAIAVEEAVRPYMMLNITKRIPYEHLGQVPVGRRNFYEQRIKLLYVLRSAKMGF